MVEVYDACQYRDKHKIFKETRDVLQYLTGPRNITENDFEFFN